MNLRTLFRCPHREHAPAVSGGVSRRQFFGSAVGLAVGAGLSKPLAAQNPHLDATPNPIPGGVAPFNIPIHHFPVTPTTTPIANMTEPSQITDFNGFVALNRIHGFGSGTGFPSLACQTDVGFMAGEYVAIDGRHYNGTFGFIWLDLYNGPVGTNQVHDYNPHISPNGLFWVIPVPDDSVEVDLGAGYARFRLTTSIWDDHDVKSSLTRVFPAGFPQMAEVTFDVEWSGIIDRAHVTSEASNFKGDFAYTGSTIQWSARDPATGFEFTSEPPNPTRLVGAVLGRERNGVFFE